MTDPNITANSVKPELPLAVAAPVHGTNDPAPQPEEYTALHTYCALSGLLFVLLFVGSPIAGVLVAITTQNVLLGVLAGVLCLMSSLAVKVSAELIELLVRLEKNTRK